MEDEMNNFISLSINNEVEQAGDYEGEDALLIIEAALNYHTGLPASAYDEIATDTFNIELPLERIVPTSQLGPPPEFVLPHETLAEIWPGILEAAALSNERVRFDDPNDPFNIVVDLEFLEYDRESEESTQTAVVRVVVQVGNNSTPQMEWECDWDSGDDWYAFGSQLGCNGNTQPSTCFKEMTKRLHILCRGQCAYVCYYSNIQQLMRDPIHDPLPFNFIPCAPTWLYWQATSPTYSECLDESQMECYTTGAYEAGQHFAPTGKCVISYDWQQWIPLCNCPSSHGAIYTYGKPNAFGCD